MKLTFSRSALLGSAAAASFALLPNAAVAQPFPDQTISGVVQQWTSAELLTIKDDRGYIDTVSVGQTTQIAGGRDALAPGARVSIKGYNGGQWFDAAQISVLAAAPQQPPTRPLPSYAHASANPYPYAVADPMNGGGSYGAAYPYQAPYAVPYGAVSPYGLAYPYYGYPYYGYGYGYGYPYYGYGYGYGVRINVGIGFGGHYGGYGRGGYGGHGHR